MLTTKDNKKMYFFLVLLTIVSYCGLRVWMTLFNNFAVEEAHFNGYMIGSLQSIREIPGFLALLIVFFLPFISEHKLASISVIILGIGIALTGFFPSYMGLVITTLLMSFGFHYFETLNQSLTLQYFGKNEAPLVFGKLRSYAAITSIAMGGLIFLLSNWLTYLQLFLLFGIIVILGGLYSIFIDPSDKKLPIQHHKMIFRKKYWLFYVLTMMAGARRQIFVAFSVFLLVKKFEFSITEISILFVVNNSINFFLNPYIGKAIKRFGERKVLSLEYFMLIPIFFVYAYTDSKLLVTIMYILDHIFFNFAIAIRTFFQKIADVKDIAPSMAVGFTINHIAAVSFPILGGILWMIDYKIPFIVGAFFSIISLIFVQLIDKQIKLRE
jgi:MFS family permease